MAGERKYARGKESHSIEPGPIGSFDKDVVKKVFVRHYRSLFSKNNIKFDLDKIRSMVSNVPALREEDRIELEASIELKESESVIDALP